MIKIVAATNNKKKLMEIRRILAPMGFAVLSLEDAGLQIAVEETEDTFSGNAQLKARAVYERCGMPTIADDSGLCVDALGGRPGVYSARYGGEGLNDADRVQLLLKEMKDVPKEKRGAKFVCAICCIPDATTMLECSGECTGSIAYQPSGEGGFGYDPIFLIDGRSYSELRAEEKDEISHRGRALENLRAMLRQRLDFMM